MPLTMSSQGLTRREMQRVRLSLSVFQDGTGWETSKKSRTTDRKSVTYAGYRQFERIIADVFGGIAPEDKGIFDVLIPIPKSGRYFGISCKMKAELNKAEKPNGRVYIELSNAAGEFTDTAKTEVGDSFQEKPGEVGQSLLTLVKRWHEQAMNRTGYKIDLAESSFLVLLYNTHLQFKIYQYSLDLPKASSLNWKFPPPTKNLAQGARRLAGYAANDDLVLEWYLHSGGQLKYYPLASDARWVTDLFDLEPLPERIKSGVIARAKQYFPKQWKECQDKSRR